MLEHIKAFFAKLPVRNMSKRKVLATVSALVVIVSVVTITAFAAAAKQKTNRSFFVLFAHQKCRYLSIKQEKNPEEVHIYVHVLLA